MVIGSRLGTVLGGTVVCELLKTHDLRVNFELGSACTDLMIQLVLWPVPKTPRFILADRAADALACLNRLRAKRGHQLMDALPRMQTRARRAFLTLLDDERLLHVCELQCFMP